MVNFSLFSEAAQKFMAEDGARRRGTTPEEERARLMAEEAKRPSRQVKLASAKLEEERKALATLQKNHPKVFQDVQKSLKKVVVDANNLGKSFTVQLRENLSLSDGKPEQQIHDLINGGVNSITFGQGSTASLFTGATFALVDRFLKNIFGSIRGVKFSETTQAEIDKHQAILDKNAPIIAKFRAEIDEIVKNFRGKTSKASFKSRQNAIGKVMNQMTPFEVESQKSAAIVKRLQEEDTKLQKITEAFRKQTEEIKEFISRTNLTSIDKFELEESIQEGSALIGESLNRQIVLEKNVLKDLQLQLQLGALKLQQPASAALKDSQTFLTGKPISVFNDTRNELNDDFGNLEGFFGAPTENIGAQVAQGLIAAGDLDEESLVKQYVKNIRAQQRAVIELGESA